MTASTPAVKPVQPTAWMRNVNAVQPSAFAGSIGFEQLDFGIDNGTLTRADSASEGITESDEDSETAPPPPPVETPSLEAPTVHLASRAKGLLTEAPYGSGKILVLTDPYIVSNAGIGLADNAQLAIISRRAARWHSMSFTGLGKCQQPGSCNFLRGRPSSRSFYNAFIVAAVFSHRARFARAVPGAETDRLSKWNMWRRWRTFRTGPGLMIGDREHYHDLRRDVPAVGLDNLSVKVVTCPGHRGTHRR